ncbi:TetR/AcrR family transcriptional regulator [Fodinicola acaciae]|uniref:TetR/AcrR family transcriptional regulator n=1 Tax=Fodinicola acaciae TaxID=2681555 RepID=UPI0013D37A5C|nr:TetR/AcrR family transcriptional regulator [Fodinicola acaciae]
MVNWEKVGEPARTARAALSYDAVAAAGVEVADTQGLDAVTMRRIAEQLGAGAMSLYRYVDSRDDLIALMVDRASAEAAVPARTGDWRVDLTGAAQAVRRMNLRHPWLTRLTLGADALGPNALAMTEAVLTLLDGHGLDIDEMQEAWRTVMAFVSGYVAAEVRRPPASDAEPSFLRTMLASGRYPLATKALLSAGPPADPDAAFRRHLGFVLDGLARTFFER